MSTTPTVEPAMSASDHNSPHNPQLNESPLQVIKSLWIIEQQNCSRISLVCPCGNYWVAIVFPSSETIPFEKVTIFFPNNVNKRQINTNPISVINLRKSTLCFKYSSNIYFNADIIKCIQGIKWRLSTWANTPSTGPPSVGHTQIPYSQTLDASKLVISYHKMWKNIRQ